MQRRYPCPPPLSARRCRLPRPHLSKSPRTRCTASPPSSSRQLGRELDALHEEVYAELGERDARYIRSTIRFHRQLVIAARLLLLRSDKRPAWLAGTAALSLAKILENMEIGHNVMHGQWDWMNDPDINSRSWDWDTASPADAWRHSHNYEHHTFTNIRGKDRDLGYEIMRIDPHQRWHPVYLLQPLYNLLLMGFFEWGVALHDLNFEAIRKGEKPKAKALAELRAIGLKARRQAVKDYIAFPLLSAVISAASSVVRPASGAFGRAVRLGLRSGRLLTARRRRRAGVRPRARSRPRSPPTSPPTSCATCGPTRSSSAGTSPTRRTPSASRRSPTRRAARGMCASCSAPPTSRAGSYFTSSAATSASRSSTTCSPTCPPAATPRSPRAYVTSATATTCRTTAGPSTASSARSTARSCASRFRAGARGRKARATGGRRLRRVRCLTHGARALIRRDLHPLVDHAHGLGVAVDHHVAPAQLRGDHSERAAAGKEVQAPVARARRCLHHATVRCPRASAWGSRSSRDRWWERSCATTHRSALALRRLLRGNEPRRHVRLAVDRRVVVVVAPRVLHIHQDRVVLGRPASPDRAP